MTKRIEFVGYQTSPKFDYLDPDQPVADWIRRRIGTAIESIVKTFRSISFFL